MAQRVQAEGGLDRLQQRVVVGADVHSRVRRRGAADRDQRNMPAARAVRARPVTAPALVPGYEQDAAAAERPQQARDEAVRIAVGGAQARAVAVVEHVGGDPREPWQVVLRQHVAE